MHSQVEKQHIPILMYHSIADRASQQFKDFAVPPALFAEHIEYLHQHGYVPLTVTQLVDRLYRDRQSLPERPVVLTFDDGFADFFTDALPILKRYNFVATLYITTGFVGDTSRWLWREGEADRPMLTWDQIREIQRQGIECGGHTHTHPQLDLLPPSAARHEIVQCKRLLEEHLGSSIFSFAYPHGYHNAAVLRAVKDAGYTSACAVKYEMSVETTNPFAFARLLAGPQTGVDELASLLRTKAPSVTNKMYKRARVPVWRLIRRGSTFMKHDTAPEHSSIIAKD